MDLINEIFANIHRLLQYQIGGLWAAFRWTCWVLQRENHVLENGVHKVYETK